MIWLQIGFWFFRIVCSVIALPFVVVAFVGKGAEWLARLIAKPAFFFGEKITLIREQEAAALQRAKAS